ncbi:methyltransferase domain-containing protein [Dysgonomonas sp. 216]|uniref:RsmD family RNA methyltransferase n=1 Tax=Dysgonomonas sp. 216 TaxID=2302934 RepID=UPI0013D0997D|nr:RsmD family RNA methyltransferase [Dysgonomonas sp. 216]NDW18020.1 methyltransferase domain-containing protein [Dysgonomonas sp. 216]
MRIISGRYKGRRISLPRNFKARPTTDFAKENLFNVLNNMVDWDGLTALDLFGGTGSISLEFASRGCSHVVCVEKSPINYSFIERTIADLKADEVLLYKMDVFKYLEVCKEQFDIIFADPPYDLKFLPEVPKLVFDKKLLKDDGIFIMEHPKEYDFSKYPLYSERRVYGSVNFSIFRKDEDSI